MGNVVGIDLGTTNSVAAFKLAEVEVVTHKDNSPPDRKLTRSVVAHYKNNLIVGDSAYNLLGSEPDNVIVSIKRLMGRGYSDPTVQQQLSRFNYKITQSTQGTENSLSVWLSNQEYQPEEISAEILKKVVQNAQTYQNEQGQKSTITQAVVTIPAYFNDKQRYATQVAVSKAGLALLELLPEPTAAAISYGFKPDCDEVSTILVYDFGGGTLDSSIITSAGNHFIESGKAGDLWLGGDDIDHIIIEYVLKQIETQEKINNIKNLIDQMPHYQKVRLLGELKTEAERAKITLSTQSIAPIQTATPILDDMGMAIPIDLTITRSTFEELITPLVDRSIKVCYDAIKYSEYPLDQIDVILLVGGTSQIPLIQQKLRLAFGSDKVIVHPRPMYAVAEGAAIVAAGLTQKVTTVSRDYCIELVDNQRFKLVSQGDILPVTKLHTFKTEADQQRLIHFKFYSPDQVSQHNERIGDMWLAFDRPYPKDTEILVTVELDEQNNSLSITAALKNNPECRVSCSFSRGGIDEDISRQVENTIRDLNESGTLTDKGVQIINEVAGEVVQSANQIYQYGELQSDRLQIAKTKLKKLEILASEDHESAQFLVKNYEWVIKYCDSMLIESQRDRIQLLIQRLKQSLDRNDLSGIQKHTEDANREFDNLPDQVKMLWVCREAITRAYHLDSNQAKVMEIKFTTMLNAMRHDDMYEADRIWVTLQPDVIKYLDRELPTGTIATGLTR